MSEITLERMLENMGRDDDDVRYHIDEVLPAGGRCAIIGSEYSMALVSQYRTNEFTHGSGVIYRYYKCH